MESHRDGLAKARGEAGPIVGTARDPVVVEMISGDAGANQGVALTTAQPTITPGRLSSAKADSLESEPKRILGGQARHRWNCGGTAIGGQAVDKAPQWLLSKEAVQQPSRE